MIFQIFGHISHAHVNPSITVGAVVLGKKTISEAVIYILSQTAGAILGYGMLKVKFWFMKTGIELKTDKYTVRTRVK